MEVRQEKVIGHGVANRVGVVGHEVHVLRRTASRVIPMADIKMCIPIVTPPVTATRATSMWGVSRGKQSCRNCEFIGTDRQVTPGLSRARHVQRNVSGAAPRSGSAAPECYSCALAAWYAIALGDITAR